MAQGTNYKVAFRRRREGKTDYLQDRPAGNDGRGGTDERSGNEGALSGNLRRCQGCQRGAL